MLTIPETQLLLQQGGIDHAATAEQDSNGISIRVRDPNRLGYTRQYFGGLRGIRIDNIHVELDGSTCLRLKEEICIESRSSTK